MSKIEFSFGDAYPNSLVSGETDMTSLLANPDQDDQEALSENADIADKTDIKSSRNKMVIAALILVCCMVVFLGVD